MPRKYTFEEVKQKFDERGFTLLENHYEGSSMKMRYRCNKHPEEIYTMQFTQLSRGCGCPKCGIETNARNRTLTIEHAREEFEKRGYILIDKAYKGAREKMKYKCPEHPNLIQSMSLNNLKRGKGCPYCARKRMGQYHKYNIDDVREAFKEKGLILLSEVYEGKHELLEYRCPKHPDKKLTKSFHNLTNSESGCPYCSGNGKPEIVEIKNEFFRRGYILLEDEYTNSHTKMRFKCIKHPDEIRTITYNDFRYQGSGCYRCSLEKRSNNNHHAWKGGVSGVSQRLRYEIKDWKYKSLKENDFKCFVTGKTTNLVVHHPIPFHVIRERAFRMTGVPKRKYMNEYTKEEFEAVRQKVIELHEELIGIPLNAEVHKEFHRKYGFDTTIEQLKEFKEEYSQTKTLC